MTKFYRDQKVELFYFTDPLCYHCWDFEPYLNKILQLYNNYVDLHILMGRIPKEATIEDKLLSVHCDQTLDRLQLPAKVFRVFSFLDPEQSQLFLRVLRQSVFVENLDISKEEILCELIDSLDGPGSEVLERAKGEEGCRRLEEDQRLAKRFGVKMIPTMVLVHSGKRVVIEGVQNEDQIVSELSSLLGHKPQKSSLRSIDEELKAMKRLYLRDLDVLYNLNPEECREYVEGSLEEGTYTWVECSGKDHYVEAK